MTRKPEISAEEGLQRLKDGNKRFLVGGVRVLDPPHETLAELARGQHPFATILGCSDSRVPPEWIFDAGLGELFVVRVAGNVRAVSQDGPFGPKRWEGKMKSWPRYPVIYEINTWIWLQELSQDYKSPVTLAKVPRETFLHSSLVTSFLPSPLAHYSCKTKVQ